MQPSTSSPVALRAPHRADGLAIHALICRCPPLDANSCYAYCVLADHHRDCCVLAEHGALGLVGCLTGYRIPARPDTLFVWQVAVDARLRGTGLAGRMLDALLARPALHDLRALETTVSPDNRASRRVFAKLALAQGATLTESPYLAADAAGAGHAAEALLRIAPLATTSPATKELS
jgi:L-2,4-diaminobutyric acid acetyltransferase